MKLKLIFTATLLSATIQGFGANPFPLKVGCTASITNPGSCVKTYSVNTCYTNLKPSAIITLTCEQEGLKASDFADNTTLEYYQNPPGPTTTAYQCYSAAWKSSTPSSQNGKTTLAFTCSP